MMMDLKTKEMIKISGNKTGGFVLTTIGKKDNFKDDIALTLDELLELQKLLNKKLK